MKRKLWKRDLCIFGVCAIFYALNQILKGLWTAPAFYLFFNGYFNDIVCGVAFCAYCNLWFVWAGRPMKGLPVICGLVLAAGLFWEYVTPLYRAGSTSDPWDVAAYLAGGLIYWIVKKMFCVFRKL